MAEWRIVRFDPSYPEPLDVEMIPLLDALNAAGLETTASCSRHGRGWPMVVLADHDPARMESLARFVIARETARGDYPASTTYFHREVVAEGWQWWLQLHQHDVYHDTPADVALSLACHALDNLTLLVNEWASGAPAIGEPPVSSVEIPENDHGK